MIPTIVKRDMLEPITDIGQLSREDIALLDLYVKRGWLSKGKGGLWRMVRYILAGFTFSQEIMTKSKQRGRLRNGGAQPAGSAKGGIYYMLEYTF
jgi:hypothetical protein